MDTTLKNNLEYTLFSWGKQAGLNPINAVKAKGSYVFDKDGKEYLDFSSQLMNVNIGHGDQRITEAVTKQMKDFAYVYPGMATDVRGLLGKKLAEITPGNLTKSFFTLGGAEAVENAIKLSRIYTKRHKIIGHYRSYHGATYAAMAVGGDPRKFAIDSQGAGNFVHVENPYFYRCPWNSTSFEECGERAFANLERIVKFENPDAIAAILLEGESGSSGCIKYPPMYLAKVRALCDQYGILLIIDETMSGFGRTGKMFGVDHHNVTPDIMCMAKGLTSGYLPLGAMTITDTIAAAFNDKPMALGLTYSAHAVSCAAALENLKIIEEESLVEKAEKMGIYIEEQVEKLKEKHPSIGDFRNTGLLGCIELVKNRETKEPITPWNAPADQMQITNEMAKKIRDLGMFTFVRWNWIFIAPPLNVSKEDVDKGLNIISEAILIADKHFY
ncbi:aminotransferase class III-fold pyridoxal phosphate-dependent enzyme [Cellulophaga baltica]|uniref:aminotransferase class III-fold pyridoxal phosphate-dependent enzyme n=1 Tax=Cellulophaga TaxID=104264 RepID=UPI001C07CB75|nr:MULTISPECIES: aminotransferase class III-fold pyridoxal phosphate-dependent enzyme [Cellulophaga]MBU2996672.1 aminotransferase class III-fold pyridoxal phosphate-dependent enzyme [Cellulophaga baltica]MDO6768066.1 aminotransferase class III-fold pyridoxal phosphate-dependent enzyme [Cellulophaga sp. 1_MG-2023]